MQPPEDMCSLLRQIRDALRGGKGEGGAPIFVLDHSGIIVTANIAQTALAEWAKRRYLYILNPESSSGESTWVAGNNSTDEGGNSGWSFTPTGADLVLWVNLAATARIDGEASGSIRLMPGESLEWGGDKIIANEVSVIAQFARQRYTLYEGAARG